MKIILIDGPGSGERYEDVDDELESTVLEHVDQIVDNPRKIRQIDRTEYVRTTAKMPDGTVIFTVKRSLPGKPINMPGMNRP